MQGCNMACAFCIVPKTRGPERSRPMEDIVEEIGELAADGTREVTLLGQIVNSYGRREFPIRNGRSPFVQLLERIEEIRGIERIRFTSPHPRGFRQDLVESFRDLSKLCECVHLPAQSGSDRMLRVMNRPYGRRHYLDIVDRLRAVVPDIYITTDVIVGFPGETDADFEETRSLFDVVGYDMAYIFRYSRRSGTPAAAMADQIDESVKVERNKILLDLLSRSSRERNARLIGTVQEVLVEGPSKRRDRYTGRTRGNRTVHFGAIDRLVGSLVPVRIERATTSSLYGEIQLLGVETRPALNV